MTSKSVTPHVAIVGAGFCGLAAGYELARRGIRVSVLEAAPEIGGLAGSFDVDGVALEKFYHHWFTNDVHIMDLVRELGVEDRILLRPTRTGMYFAKSFFKLSTPLDVLRFTALPFIDRLRLGLMTLKARRVTDWRALETVAVSDWLRQMGGERVYEVVWEPLLRGKFGDVAEEISAVWFWNKLKLRGGSRGKGGAEQLAYYRGGFAALAERMAEAIRSAGGTVATGAAVTGLTTRDGRVLGVVTGDGPLAADAVLATTPLPITADLVEGHTSPDYIDRLRRVRYLANICIVLELDRSISETYWLNVNDPGFPFVGVIEHTNFEPASTYHGRHIVYLSKYLHEEDALYRMADAEAADFALTHLKRMFREFDRAWVLDTHVWRAQFSQPIVEKNYSALIPEVASPLQGFYVSTMAQIYPEDRGTNYAIREGRKAAAMLAGDLGVAPRAVVEKTEGIC